MAELSAHIGVEASGVLFLGRTFDKGAGDFCQGRVKFYQPATQRFSNSTLGLMVIPSVVYMSAAELASQTWQNMAVVIFSREGFTLGFHYKTNYTS